MEENERGREMERGGGLCKHGSALMLLIGWKWSVSIFLSPHSLFLSVSFSSRSFPNTAYPCAPFFFKANSALYCSIIQAHTPINTTTKTYSSWITHKKKQPSGVDWMLHFLYNMMVHGTVRGGDGPAAAHGATLATVLVSLAASRQSVCLSQNVLDIIQWQSSLSLSYVWFTFSVSLILHFLLHAQYYYIFVYTLHHTLPKRTSLRLSASWNHNHKNLVRSTNLLADMKWIY